jgi:hypothetical protein
MPFLLSRVGTYSPTKTWTHSHLLGSVASFNNPLTEFFDAAVVARLRVESEMDDELGVAAAIPYV